MKFNSASILKKIKPVVNLFFLFLCFMFLLTACGGNKATRNAEDLKSYDELQELINNREFEIENQWALPLRGNNINLIGNPNFIRFKGDSVDVFLPYFGVRHSGGGYGTGEGGIKYEGLAEELSVVENKAKRNIVIKFEGDQRNENLQFFITVYPNRNTFTLVSSSQRDAISYQGDIQVTEEEEQQ